MSVSREHIDHLCTLAALNLSDEQKAQFTPQLDAIVGMISQLESLELGDSEDLPSYLISHTNTGLLPSNTAVMENVHHPIAGNMPAVSFSTGSN